MNYLTENQVKVLRLRTKGLAPSEISKETGLGSSSVYEAIKRGRRRIEYSTDLLVFALTNGLLSLKERESLMATLSKA
jgi:transcriptional regulator